MDNIILVEDDEKLSSLIQKYLQQHNFKVQIINNGNLAVDEILNQKPQAVILDLMLPGKDGLSICREIRNQYKGCILFLTASEDDMDHVAGVELGADDYIIKPIQPRVLLARIRMLLRRSSIQNHSQTQLTQIENTNRSTLQFGQLLIQYSKRSVTLKNQIIALTSSELDLLWLLANHCEKILSRDFIYKELRGIEYNGLDRAIDTNITNLRKKLGDNASLSTRIITVRGQGYLFIPDAWD